MTVYKVLASDDEQIVLDSFRWILQQTFPDRLEIHTARNGLEAIRLAAEIKPDIFLMDILMPGLNGIETIRALRETDPRALFIILSAHNDFSYAREAVSLGVFEYLLKPMERSSLVNVLEAALARLKERDDRAQRQWALLERVERLEPALEQAYIHAVIDYRAEPENLESMVPLFLASGASGFFLNLCFESEAPVIKSPTSVRDLVKQKLNCLVGPWVLGRLPVFCLAEDHQAVGELAQRLSGLGLGTCRIGVGRPGHDGASLYASYQESLWALAASRDTLVNVFSAAPEAPNLAAQGTDEKQFLLYLRQGRVHDARRYFEDLVLSWRTAWPDGETIVRRHIMELLIVAKNSVMPLGKAGRADIVLIMEGFDPQISLAIWLGPLETLVTRACSYLETSFDKDLSLDDIACAVGVSTGHLSHVFKQGLGVTVLDYLTDLRVNRARELLEHSQYSIKQIAGLVGYRDPNYLSRLFKQKTGRTLSDLRQKAVQS